MADVPGADHTAKDAANIPAADDGAPPFQGAAHGAGAGGSFVLQDVQREQAQAA